MLKFLILVLLTIRKRSGYVAAGDLSGKGAKFWIQTFGSWMVKKPWLTNITYNFAGDFKNEDYYEYKVMVVVEPLPLPTATVSGESVGTLLLPVTTANSASKGSPTAYFATVKGNVAGKYGKVYSNLMYGVEWRTTGNNGAGSVYDVTRPPGGTEEARPDPDHSKTYRPTKIWRCFWKKSKFCHWLNRIENAGRIEVQQHASYRTFSTKGFKSLEPRLNLTYDIFREEEWLDDSGSFRTVWIWTDLQDPIHDLPLS